MPTPLWCALAVIAAEYFILSASFDAAPLLQRSDAWVLAGYLGSAAVVVAVAVVGTLLVTTVGHRPAQSLLAARHDDRRVIPALATHLACAVSLWWITSQMLSAAGPPNGPPLAWLTLWSALVAATAFSATSAALPAQRLRTTLRTISPALAGGSVIGLGAWLAGQGSALLWRPFGPWTLEAVAWSLRALLDETFYDPAQSIVGSTRFQVIVDPSCSGLEGAGLIAALVTSYLVLARRQLRFPQALLLLPFGIVASLAANVMRIVALTFLGTFLSPSIAAGGFHARAGWLFFSVLALGLVLLARRLPFLAREVQAVSLDHPTAAFLLPLLALLAAGMLAGLAAAHVDLLYGVRVLAPIPVLYAFRRHYRGVRCAWTWSDVAAGVVAAAAFVALAPRPGPEEEQAWEAEMAALPPWGRASWATIRVLGSVLIVPLVEELAFRGYAMRRLIAVEFEKVPTGQLSLLALVVSSAVFGTIHSGWLGGAIAGLLFGLAQIRGGNVGHAVTAHVVANAAVAAWVLGFGQWWLWM